MLKSGGGSPAVDKQPAPTGKIAWVGFGLCVFALAAIAVAFCSPYWLQTWPKSENRFRSIGLWHVCFYNYMQFKDDSQEVYSECWWVFDQEPKYYKLREWLMPPWFITCQVLTAGSLMVELFTMICTGLIFLHLCPMMNHEYLQTYGIFASGSMMFLATMVCIVVAILFGYQVNDRYWLPRPDQNYLSWGFGFLVISAMAALASGLCLFKAAWDTYRELLYREDEYTKQAMELSTFQMETGQPSQQEFEVVQPGYSGVQPFGPEEPYDPQESFSVRPPSYQQAPGYPQPPSYSVPPPAVHAEPSFEHRPTSYRYDQEPSMPLMGAERQQDFGEFSHVPESGAFGKSFEQPSGYAGKSYDRSYERHYSDTSFNDAEQEMMTSKPERRY